MKTKIMNRSLLLIAVFCIATSIVSFAEPINHPAIQQILEDTQIDPFERYKKAANAVRSSGMPDSVAMLLHKGVMMSFCENQIKDPEHRNRAFANTYDCIRMYNNRLGNSAGSLIAIKAAIPYLEQCQDARTKADFYRGFGGDELTHGDRTRAFDYLNRSIQASEQVDGYEQMINVCYYFLAIPFQEMRDHNALADIIAKMKVVAARAKDEIASYQLYAVQTGYFDSKINADSIDRNIVDSALYYAKKAIRVNEKYGDKVHHTTMPLWSYYNVAAMYHLYFDPPMTDSIDLYLTKAERLNTTNDEEIIVSLKDLKAWSYLHKKEYRKAESTMLEAIDMMDASHRHTFIIDRCEAYRFMVEFYKQTGDLQNALRYQELFTEVYKERFNGDKNRALRDLTIKYDVEKKESEISFLKERNAYALRLNIFGFTTAILLFMALMLGVFIVRLRKRNYEQQIYETAMEAEMSRQELEYFKDGIRPSRAIVGKLIETIQGLPFNMENRAIYLERLSTLDFEAIERQYLTAKTRLSAMDMRYIICFFIDMSVCDISLLFNIEPTSVHTVRYRIKKKFGKADSWSF